MQLEKAAQSNFVKKRAHNIKMKLTPGWEVFEVHTNLSLDADFLHGEV